MKTKNKRLWRQASNAWTIFAVATTLAMFMLPGSLAAKCVQTGTEVICTGPYFSNSNLFNRENPGDNLEVLTIDGREAPVTITRNDWISNISFLNGSSWNKNTTLNLLGDVTVSNTGAWVNNVPGIQMVQEGNQGGLFLNMSPSSSIETADACLTCGNHGIYMFISNDANPGDIGVDASGSISAIGPGAHGIYGLHNGTGDIDVNWGGTIDITGESSRGIFAHHQGQGGIAVASTGTIEASGNATHGVYALISKNNNNADMAVAIDSGKIQTSGVEAHAVHLEHQGTGDRSITVGEGATVHASGAKAHGLHIANTGSGDNTLTVAGTVIGGTDSAYAIVTQTQEDGKSYLSIEDTARISAASGNAIRNDAGDSETTVAPGAQISGAIRLGDGSDHLTFNGTDISGITIMNGGDDRSTTDGWNDILTFENVSGELNGQKVLNWEVIEIDQLSVLTGSGYWQAGQTAEANTGVWIKNGANLQIVDGFHLRGNLHIQESGMLSGMGSSYTVTGPVNNAGSINLHNASVSDTLTIKGDYHGDNGQLHLDTILGGDGSVTDKLIVEGNTSGNTDVYIHNAGGSGSETLQGIEVIRVLGTSDEEHFTKAGVVEAGAYEYFLFRGKPDEENSNFYLRSHYEAPDPGPEPDPEVYRAAVPGYVLGQAATQEMVYASMGGTLHQRMGEQQTFKWDYCGCDPEKPGDQMWLRLGGQWLDIDGRRQFGLEQDMFLVQLGKDLIISYDEDDHRHRHTGVMLSYGKTEADFYDRDRRTAGLGKTSGEMTGETGALGIYHTRYADNGVYQDFVGQVHHSRNRYTDMNGQKAKQNGTGFGLSAEMGRPWQIKDTLWLVEPQAQLSYQLTRYGDFSDDIATIDDFTSQNLRGRIGARFAWNNRIQDTERTKTIYVTASLLHDFLDPKTVAIGGDSVKEKADEPTWGELGLHGQYRLTDATYLYGGAQYQRSIDSGSREGYGGQVGVRAAW